MRFIDELRRRQVFKVAAAYAVVAWLLAQVASVVFPALYLEPWTVTFVTAVLILLFPVAILLAWAFELSPQGIRRMRPIAANAAKTGPAGASHVVTALVAGGIGAGAFWYFSLDPDADRIEQDVIPQIEDRIASGDWEAAFALTEEAEAQFGAHPALAELWPRFSWRLTIPSEPPGATVFRRAYSAADSAWEELGVTPLQNIRIPFGLSRLRFELDGYVTLDRTIGGGVLVWTELPAADPLANDSWYIGPETYRLDTAETLPEGKVRVPGWTQDIAGEQAAFRDFFLDRTEVTNAEYKVFVDAGGYSQPNLWDPVRIDGEEVPWNEAMTLFVDRTGWPGPSTWEAGDYPDGQADMPVSGVSWYEAAAYARFMREELPTIHHWRRAFAGAMYPWELPASNFDGDGPLPVGASGAMSYVGAYDMAGNVREWTATAIGDGRVILGGSWYDPPSAPLNPYTPSAPPLDRSDGNGLRLAITRDDPAATALARAPLNPAPAVAERQPVADDVFRAYSRVYDYERSALNPSTDVEARQQTRIWMRERIAFDAAYEGERVVLYLYLPRNSAPPYQTVLYWPGAAALAMSSVDEYPMLLDFVLKSGRAVAFPVYRGTFERRATNSNPSARERLDTLIKAIKDLRRSVDYLQTRPDVDPDVFAFFGHSWGGAIAPVVLAQEPRIRAAVAYVGYVPPVSVFPEWAEPELDPVNALPRVDVPVLMLNGEFDPSIPPGSDSLFYELLGTPDEHKRHLVEPAGHYVPRTTLIRETDAWLDRYLGTPRTAAAGSMP